MATEKASTAASHAPNNAGDTVALDPQAFFKKDLNATDDIERWSDRIDFGLAMALEEQDDGDVEGYLGSYLRIAMIDSARYAQLRDAFRKGDARDDHWTPAVEDTYGECDRSLRNMLSVVLRAGMLVERARSAGWKELAAARRAAAAVPSATPESSV